MKSSDQLCKLVGAFFLSSFSGGRIDSRRVRGRVHVDILCHTEDRNLHGLCGISQSAHEEEEICWSMQLVLLLVVLAEKQLPEFTE